MDATIDWESVTSLKNIPESRSPVGGKFTKVVEGHTGQIYCIGFTYTNDRPVTDGTVSILETNLDGSPSRSADSVEGYNGILSAGYRSYTPFSDRFTSAVMDDMDNVVTVGYLSNKRRYCGLVKRITSTLGKINDGRCHELNLPNLMIVDIVFNPRRCSYLLLCNSAIGVQLIELSYDFKQIQNRTFAGNRGEKLLLTQDGSYDYIMLAAVGDSGVNIVRLSGDLKCVANFSHNRIIINGSGLAIYEDFGLLFTGYLQVPDDIRSENRLEIACLDTTSLELRMDDSFPITISIEKKSPNQALAVARDGSIIVSCIPGDGKYGLAQLDPKTDVFNQYAVDSSDIVINDLILVGDVIMSVGQSTSADGINIEPSIITFHL